MSATLVHSNKGEGSTATTNPTLGATATSGNLLVLIVTSDDYKTGIPTGYTESNQMGIGGAGQFHGSYLWWKISNGTETGTSYTILSATVSAWQMLEFSGLTSSPYDVSAGQEVNSSTTTYSTPSITPTTGDRFLICVGMASRGSAQANLTSFSDSFVIGAQQLTTNGSGTRDMNAYGTKAVTGDGSTTFKVTTITYNGIEQAKSGLIIAFKVASGSTPISDSDTGSGVDAVSLIGTSNTETSSGADTATLAASLTTTETGSGTEAVSIALAAVDTGTGLDAVTRVGISDTETGSGTDTGSIAASLSNSDVGTSLDAVSGIALASSDTGTDTENQTISISISSTDTGSGSDAVTQIGTSSTDLTSGADTGTLAANVSNSDTGTSLDAVTLISLSAADISSGTETQTISISITSTDIGSGLDATAGIALNSAETGSGSDTATLAVSLAQTDTGTGADLVGGIALTNTETGSGSDVVVRVALTTSDLGTVLDAQSIAAQLATVDTGSGLDTYALTAAVADSDSVTWTETGSVLVIGAVIALVTVRVKLARDNRVLFWLDNRHELQ